MQRGRTAGRAACLAFGTGEPRSCKLVLPVPAFLFYVDESYDAQKFCLSAIMLRHDKWRDAFEMVKAHRAKLKQTDGIYVRKEIHAREFIKGRGHVAPDIVTKHRRSQIFQGWLQLAASLPSVAIFNCCLASAEHPDPQMVAWDRLVNRICRTMQTFEDDFSGTHLKVIEENTKCEPDALAAIGARLRPDCRAMIVADEGHENEITKAVRRMQVFNPIPSKFGSWGSAGYTKNIPAHRLLEDPVFKSSAQSYFLQLVDAVAFALLKREVAATPVVARYGYDKMFDQTIAPVCFRPASKGDPLGIVRK